MKGSKHTQNLNLPSLYTHFFSSFFSISFLLSSFSLLFLFSFYLLPLTYSLSPSPFPLPSSMHLYIVWNLEAPPSLTTFLHIHQIYTKNPPPLLPFLSPRFSREALTFFFSSFSLSLSLISSLFLSLPSPFYHFHPFTVPRYVFFLPSR